MNSKTDNGLSIMAREHLLRVRVEKLCAAEGDLSAKAAYALVCQRLDLANYSFNHTERISPTVVDVYFQELHR